MLSHSPTMKSVTSPRRTLDNPIGYTCSYNGYVCCFREVLMTRACSERWLVEGSTSILAHVSPAKMIRFVGNADCIAL